MRRFVLGFLVFIQILQVNADINIRHRSTLKPSDYLMRDHTRRDRTFDDLKVVDLGFNVGLGSDCGKIKLDASLKASLGKIFESNFLGNMGQDILDGSWMLIICYLSPNWCSILRHFRLQANFVGRMRQNQCDAINKYVDSRVSEFNRSRQQCVSDALAKDGNAEEIAACGNRQIYKFDLKSWAGEGKPTPNQNRLLHDSATWAGFNDSAVLNLAKQFVGDTIVGRGKVQIEYGPDKVYIPPKNHLIKMAKKTKQTLCEGLLKKIDNSSDGPEAAITDQDIVSLNGSKNIEYIDRQTIRFLSMLPYRKRRYYCSKIALALANARFTHESSQVMEFLNLVSQNPNLPHERRQEVLDKKNSFKESIENIRFEQEQTNTPLNQIATEISKEGLRYQNNFVKREARAGKARRTNYRTNTLFYNCVTPAMCDRRQ